MTAFPSLLVFGLDGLSPDVLRALSGAGHLPHLAEFARAATLDAVTRCTWPPHTASGWTTLFSGRLPGEHGHYQFWSCDPAESALRPLARHEAGVEFVWDRLNRDGRTVGLVNVPMTHPPQGLDGYEFTWPLTTTLRYSHPPGLLGEIVEAGGLALPDIACMYRGDRSYWRQAVTTIRRRTRGILHLMDVRPVDALFVVYPEVDRICHHYWPSFDHAHPEHEAVPETEAAALPAVARALDDAFAAILAKAGPAAAVLVASDHGFGPATRALRVERVLADHGLLTFDASGDADRTLSRAWLAAPGSYALNLDAAVGGRVRDLMLGLRGPDGGPVFQAAVDADRAYGGPARHTAPDLLLVPSDPGLVVLPGDGPPWDQPGVNGTHRMEGVAMARIPGAPRCDANRVPLEAVMDFVLGGGRGDFGSPLAALRERGIPDVAWSGRGERIDLRPRPGAVAEPDAADEPGAIESEASAAERLRLMGYL